MEPNRNSGILRATLKQVPGLRSAYYLSIVLRQMAADPWRQPSSFDRIFAAQPDPWESDSESEGKRFALTLSLLAESGRKRFGDAVEMGCAEGIFTQRLAPWCDRLTALDFSEVALDRARQRLEGSPNVVFRRYDMRGDPMPGEYDLVVAMGVISSLYRPGDVRRVCAGVIDVMRPGGFLLFSDVRQSRMFEEAWWGRFALRGGEQIRRLLSRRGELELVRSADTATHVFALYRRVAYNGLAARERVA